MSYDSTTWSQRHEKIRVSSTVMIQGRESGRLSRKLGVETKHGLTKGDAAKVHNAEYVPTSGGRSHRILLSVLDAVCNISTPCTSAWNSPEHAKREKTESIVKQSV